MKKVLILANNDEGFYKFRNELIKELVTKYEVYLSLPKGRYTEHLIKLGCKFIDTEIDRRGTSLIKDFKLLTFYRKIVNEIKPEIILTYTIKPNIYGGIIARIFKIPYVTNITGLGTSVQNAGGLQRFIRNLYKLALGNAQTVFFQNEKNRERFIKRNIAVSKHKMLPGSGVNLNHFKVLEYPNSKAIHFVFISRIMKDKGIDEYLKAAEYFTEKDSSLHFHICGFTEEDYESILKDYVKKGIIQYHGMVSDIREILKVTHCTIHPSYHEGMSNVLLESAASGRPVLASNIPGCIETFDEGISGFSFESQNTESLIQAINKFISLSHEEKRVMGNAGRKKVEKEFNRQIVVDAYVAEVKKV